MDPATIAMLASMAISSLSGLGGKNERHGSTYTKPQRMQINDILQSIKGMKGQQDITQQPGYQTGLGFLQSMFSDPEFFNRFEAPAFRQFNEQIIPDLATRYASMGSGGSTGSTGFRNQLAREGSNLATNLAAQRGQMQQNAVPQLLGYSQQPFSNYMSLLNTALTPTQNTYQPASAGFFGPVAAGLSSGAAQGFGQQWGQNMATNYSTQPAGQSGATGRQLFPGQSPSTY